MALGLQRLDKIRFGEVDLKNNMITMNDKWLVIGLVIISVYTISVIGYQVVAAYDVPEVIDPPSEATRSLETQIYKFGASKDDIVEYSDGTVVPTRTFSIELWNSTTQQWEIVGYANTHLHKVKVDNTDQFDISVGSTVRINPKN